MKIYLHSLFFFLLASCVHPQQLKNTKQKNTEEMDTVSYSRHFELITCKKSRGCTGPFIANLNQSNVELHLKPFRKLDKKGLDGWDRHSFELGGIKISSEIHVMKTKDFSKNGYFVYAMIRSGKRNGKVLTFRVKNFAEGEAVVVTDAPIKTSYGTLQAILVIEPPLIFE